MTSLPLQDSPLFCSPAREPERFAFGSWTLLEYDVVNSTNLVAAKLPAWHAVRAQNQTAGRGRFERPWVSDSGGLWFSAVLPVEGDSARLGLLPLIAGLAVCDALRALGVNEVRMRWPNDVLVGTRKLAGLLIDQFRPGLAVAGIGLNVNNRPEEKDSALRGQVARLADWVSPLPGLGEVLRCLLMSLETVWEVRARAVPEALLPRINTLWRPHQKVQIELNHETIVGEFRGVDATGRLMLAVAHDQTRFYQPHEVRLLREIP